MNGLPPVIMSIAAGPNSTAAVSQEGELYTWGSGLKLGHGVLDVVPRPRRVGGALASEVVTSVSIGEDHAACFVFHLQ